MEVDLPIVLKTLRETGDFLTKSSFLFLFHSGFPVVETWPLEKLEIVRDRGEPIKGLSGSFDWPLLGDEEVSTEFQARGKINL